MRRSSKTRLTKETDIEVAVALDGAGIFTGSSKISFLDHILTLMAHHTMADISLRASWDLVHHGVEDIAILLGRAIGDALGSREGIRRFGFAIVPMDEALAEAAVDLVNRSHISIQLQIPMGSIEDMKSEDIYHFFHSLVTSVPAVAHIHVKYGVNDHHKVEAAVKAFAIALRKAWSLDPARQGSPSSKGIM